MSRLLRSFLLTACGILFAVATPTAEAGYPYSYAGFGYQGVGGWNGLYGRGHFQTRPYFALNPPVYYGSQITPRAYGRSPYAALPLAGNGHHGNHHSRAAQISHEPVSSGIIVNPFFGNSHTEPSPIPDNVLPTPEPTFGAPPIEPGIQTNPMVIENPTPAPRVDAPTPAPTPEPGDPGFEAEEDSKEAEANDEKDASDEVGPIL